MRLDGNFDSYRDMIRSFQGGFKNGITNIQDEPTFLGFSVFFFFDSDDSPLLNLKSSDMFGNEANSAYSFLKRAGYDSKAEMLLRFIRALRDIQQNRPWFFQTITGLDELFSWDFSKNKVRGNNGESLLTIGTLESLDLRITGLLDLYLHSCFDYTYRREIVPSNLRKFKMAIYIQEIRSFQKYINFLDDKGVESYKSALDVNGIDQDDMTRLFITLDGCQFAKNTMGLFASTISNTEFSEAKSNLILEYTGDVSFENIYSGYGISSNTQTNSQYTARGIDSFGPRPQVFPTTGRAVPPPIQILGVPGTGAASSTVPTRDNALYERLQEVGQRFEKGFDSIKQNSSDSARSLVNIARNDIRRRVEEVGQRFANGIFNGDSTIADSIFLGNVYGAIARQDFERLLFQSVFNRR